MKKAIIILPTYNEKGNIEKIVELLENDVFPKITSWEMGILVADDTSPDGTSDIVRGLMKQYKNLDLLVGPKKGLGAAYTRGMDYAIKELQADVMFEMDSDGQHDATKIPEFLKKIDEGYDFVIGTRYSGGGSIPKGWGLHRKFLSVFGNIIIRTILMRFAIHDWTGGYRAIKKEVFLKEKHKLKDFTGYTFQVGTLLNAVQDGFKIGEVPFHFGERTQGVSKIPGMKTIIDTFSYVLIARIKELKRFIKFLFVGGTGFLVQVVTQELAYRLGLAMALTVVFSSVSTHGAQSATVQGTAAGIGAEAAILSNFFFNNFWTFSDTTKLADSSPFIIRLITFNISSLMSIIIQSIAVGFGVTFLGNSVRLFSFDLPIRILILFPTIILLVIPINYFVYNKFIWKTHQLNHGKTS